MYTKRQKDIYANRKHKTTSKSTRCDNIVCFGCAFDVVEFEFFSWAFFFLRESLQALGCSFSHFPSQPLFQCFSKLLLINFWQNLGWSFYNLFRSRSSGNSGEKCKKHVLTVVVLSLLWRWIRGDIYSELSRWSTAWGSSVGFSRDSPTNVETLKSFIFCYNC